MTDNIIKFESKHDSDESISVIQCECGSQTWILKVEGEIFCDKCEGTLDGEWNLYDD